MLEGPTSETFDDVGGGLLDAFFSASGLPTPGLGKVFARGVRKEWSRNRSTALRVAEQISNMSREDLAQAISEDPRLVPLVTRLLHAAGMNGHDGTLRAMGAAFGDAVRDRSQVDECELILTSLSDLTGDHASILQLLATEPPERRPRVGDVKLGDEDLPISWTPEALEIRSPISPRATTICIATLVARGLAHATSGLGGGTVYEITALGFVVLDVLHQYSAEA